jgi:hypothetical protein
MSAAKAPLTRSPQRPLHALYRPRSALPPPIPARVAVARARRRALHALVRRAGPRIGGERGSRAVAGSRCSRRCCAVPVRARSRASSHVGQNRVIPAGRRRRAHCVLAAGRGPDPLRAPTDREMPLPCPIPTRGALVQARAASSALVRRAGPRDRGRTGTARGSVIVPGCAAPVRARSRASRTKDRTARYAPATAATLTAGESPFSNRFRLQRQPDTLPSHGRHREPPQ